MNDINKLQKGQLMLVISNGDGTFSPIRMTVEQSQMMNIFIGGVSQHGTPLFADRRTKLEVREE